MSLSLPNVSLLGMTQEARFFDAGFQFASFRRLSVQGTCNDLAVNFGITGTWSGAEGMLNTIANNHDYQGLVLNGVNFGSGRLESISFGPGNDVKLKPYTANIVVYDSGNLFNFTGVYYSGVNISSFQYLQTFSENWTFDHKLNGGYSYAHNANIQFTSGVGQLNAIGAAQAVARSVFTGSNLGFAFYPAYTNTQGKRYFTESYNLITNECAFQETFDFDSFNVTYSATHTHTVQLDEQGVITASEQGVIRGIQNPNWQNALSAISVEMTGSYYRSSGAASYYFPTGAVLHPSPLSQGRTIDIFNNNIGYTVAFDNSPTNSGTYFWDYTLQADKADGVTTVTEQGNVIGRDGNPTLAFEAAQGGFVIVQPGIQGRVNDMFVGGFAPATNYLILKDQSYSPQQGTIGYSYSYSNDPTLIANAGIRRKTVTERTNDSIYSYNVVDVFNVAQIAQNDFQSTPATTEITVAMEGDRTVSLSTFLSAAITEINSRIPVGNDRYIGDCSYSYAPNEGTNDVSLTWIYNKPAVQTIQP